MTFDSLLYAQNLTIQQNAALQQLYFPRLKYEQRVAGCFVTYHTLYQTG